MTRTEELAARWSAVMMSNYRTPPVALAHGAGATVWDVDGREYTDLLGGIATTILGHAHPKVVEAITAQAAEARPRLQPGDARARAAAGRAAARPRRPARAGSSSATPAPRPTRRRSRSAGSPAGPRWSPPSGSFHGRTMGALALTGQPARPTRSRRCPAASGTCPTATPTRWPARSGERTAMVLLEPMLGEGGVLPAPSGYLAAGRLGRRRTPARCSPLDEVQTGIGRTGHWFAHQADGLQPDIITLAKALGGGLPIGAPLAFGDAAELLTAGAHGSTFGGNPIAAAAALAVLDTIRDEGLLERAKELEHRFTAGIEGLGHAGISGVRGRGALLGVVLTARRRRRARGRSCAPPAS